MLPSSYLYESRLAALSDDGKRFDTRLVGSHSRDRTSLVRLGCLGFNI